MIVRIGLALATIAVAGAYVWLGVKDPWDFSTYYFAAKAFREGLNPYSLSALSEVAGRTIELPFVYPPTTLALFLPFTALPLMTASVVWLAFKLACLLLLLWIWHRHFLRNVDLWLLIVATLLGFNLAVLWDLRTGNVALLEATVLWTAFLCYLKGRDRLATYLICVGSLFKLLPVLMLGILLFRPRPAASRFGLVIIGVLFFLASVLLPFGLGSAWISAMAVSAGDLPTPEINPSALAISTWVVGALELPSGAAAGLGVGLYLLYCAAILLTSLGALLHVQKHGSRPEHVIGVLLIWLLITPRLMVYSYVLAIVPVLWIVHRLRNGPLRAIIVILIIAQGVVRLLPGAVPKSLAPLPFLILIACWIVWHSTAKRVKGRVLTGV